MAAACMDGVDLDTLAKRICAPTLSFDWQAPPGFKEADGDVGDHGSFLEVELPPNVEVRGLLRQQLEKKVAAARVSQLMAPPPNVQGKLAR